MSLDHRNVVGFASLPPVASLLEALYTLFIFFYMWFFVVVVVLVLFFFLYTGGVFIFLVACVFQRADTDSMFCRKLEETNVSH